MGAVPRSTVDLFAADVTKEPYEHYRRLRDAGPVVFLERLGAYAFARYDDVRASCGTGGRSARPRARRSTPR